MTATNPVSTRSDFGSDGGHSDGGGSHATDGHAADGHAADGHAADGHAADGHAADGHAADGHAADGHVSQRRSTETKASAKTTEFMVYLAAVAAVIITALVVGKDGNGADPFSALDAIRYISYLTIGYMIARGLAKSGSREDYFQDRGAQR